MSIEAAIERASAIGAGVIAGATSRSGIGAGSGAAVRQRSPQSANDFAGQHGHFFAPPS